MRSTEKNTGRRCIRARRIRKRRQLIGGGILLTAVIAAVIALCGVRVQADTPEAPQRYKYFTSVYIDRDDNLWKIAQEYMTDEYTDIREYVDEVMAINHMADDQLSYGERITVPYYSSQWK